MKPGTVRGLIGGLLLIVLAVSVGYLSGKIFRGKKPATPVASVSPQKVGEPNMSSDTPVAPTAHTSTPVSTSNDPLTAALELLLQRLAKGSLPTAEELDAFKKLLLAAPQTEAMRAIAAFLDSGRDASLGGAFEIAEGGALSAAPTLRAWLLDLFGQIARTSKSVEAATYARKVLEKPTTPDEWALAMRNVAWADTGSRAYVAGKFREMINHKDWRSAPTGGLLEAFDFVVFSRDAAFVNDLQTLLSGDDEDLQRASAVALDRLADAAPLEVMRQLNSNPTLMAERPMMRADYFTKADFTQLAQRQAVEAYLGRLDVGEKEKLKFISGVAAPGSFVAENLVTTNDDPDPKSETARRDALTAAVGQWLTADSFPALKPALERLQHRLSR